MDILKPGAMISSNEKPKKPAANPVGGAGLSGNEEKRQQDDLDAAAAAAAAEQSQQKASNNTTDPASAPSSKEPSPQDGEAEKKKEKRELSSSFSDAWCRVLHEMILNSTWIPGFAKKPIMALVSGAAAMGNLVEAGFHAVLGKTDKAKNGLGSAMGHLNDALFGAPLALFNRFKEKNQTGEKVEHNEGATKKEEEVTRVEPETKTETTQKSVANQREQTVTTPPPAPSTPAEVKPLPPGGTRQSLKEESLKEESLKEESLKEESLKVYSRSSVDGLPAESPSPATQEENAPSATGMSLK